VVKLEAEAEKNAGIIDEQERTAFAASAYNPFYLSPLQCHHDNRKQVSYYYRRVGVETIPHCSHTTWQKPDPDQAKNEDPLNSPTHLTVDMPGSVYQNTNPSQWDYSIMQYEDQLRIHGPKSFLEGVSRRFAGYNGADTYILGRVVGLLGYGKRGRKSEPSPNPMNSTFETEMDFLVEVTMMAIPVTYPTGAQGIQWAEPVYSNEGPNSDTQQYPQLQPGINGHRLRGSYNYWCSGNQLGGNCMGAMRHVGRTYMVVSNKNHWLQTGGVYLFPVTRDDNKNFEPREGMSAVLHNNTVATTGVGMGQPKGPINGKDLQDLATSIKNQNSGRTPGDVSLDAEKEAATVVGRFEDFGSMARVAAQRRLQSANAVPIEKLSIASGATIGNSVNVTIPGTLNPYPNRVKVSFDLRAFITLPRRWCRDINGRWSWSSGEKRLIATRYWGVQENLMWGRYGRIEYQQLCKTYRKNAAITVLKHAATLV